MIDLIYHAEISINRIMIATMHAGIKIATITDLPMRDTFKLKL